MYTLKISWTSREDESGIVTDETTIFLPADSVRVHGNVTDIEGDYAVEMNAWAREDWHEYRNVRLYGDGVTQQTTVHEVGKLIAVTLAGEETYYAASRAWILGPTGATIERVA